MHCYSPFHRRPALLLAGCLALLGTSVGSISAHPTQQAPGSRPTAAQLEAELNGIEADMKRGNKPATTASRPTARPAAATPKPATSAATPAAATPDATAAAARALRVVGFMAVYPLSAADQQQLKATVVRNYAANRSYFATIDKVYRDIQNCSSDMWYSAQLRENMWQGIGKHPAPDMLLSVVYKYNPIVAQAGGQTVTKVAVQDMLAARTLVAKAAGLPATNQSSEAATVAAGCQRVARTFASLPAAEQAALVHGESRYQALAKLLSSSGAEHTRAVAAMKQQVHTEADLPPATRRFEEQGGRYAQQATSPANVTNEMLRTSIIGYSTLSAFPGWGH